MSPSIRRPTPGADHRHNLFKLGHLARVGRLIPQHPHMVGQAAPVDIVGPLAQEIEHLRKSQSHKEVIGLGGVRDNKEHRRFPIPDAVKLQLVIRHNLPELWDVKGRKPGPTGNQNAFCCLASDVL